MTDYAQSHAKITPWHPETPLKEVRDAHRKAYETAKIDNKPMQRQRSNSESYGAHQSQQRQTGRRLSPEAVARLYQFGDVLKQESKGDTEQEVATTELEMAWDSGNAWHVFGQLPHGIGGFFGEAPLAARPLGILPRTGNWSPDDLLEYCGVAAVNATGNPRSYVGQDNFSVSCLPNGWEAFCCADGHGVDGHYVAERAVHVLPFFLQGKVCSAMLKAGQVEAALVYAFEKTEADLEAWAYASEQYLSCSGCTAVCALRCHRGQEVWVAHVGDSRAILLESGGKALSCSRDHKPQVPAEKQRVQARGGRIGVRRDKSGHQDERVFGGSGVRIGLSMTRSFGDLALKPFGVVAKPDVVKWTLEDGCGERWLLLASDGIWEVLRSEEVAIFVDDRLSSGMSPRATLQVLLEKVQALWSETVSTDYCDDVTVVLVALDGPGLANAAPGHRMGRSIWSTISCMTRGLFQ